MTEAHTHGRITFHADGDANHYSMLTEDGRWWLSLILNGEQVTARQEANLRRLAACWNACEGISTDALTKGRLSPDAFEVQQSRADTAERQRDELLEALKGLDEAYCRAGLPLDREERTQDRKRLIAARAAIAKATGSAQ